MCVWSSRKNDKKDKMLLTYSALLHSQATMILEVCVFLAIILSMAALFVGIYSLYRASVCRSTMDEKMDRLEARFKLLVDALNKVNYSEYVYDVKQEEDINKLKRSKGL